MKENDFSNAIIEFNNSLDKHDRIFSNCVDERYDCIVGHIINMIQFVSNNHRPSAVADENSVKNLNGWDIMYSSSTILFSILETACSKIRKVKRKKYADSAIKNFNQIVSFIMYYYDSIGSFYEYILPNTYLKDMFGKAYTKEDIKLISDPIEYLKLYNGSENSANKKIWERDTEIAVNLNIIKMSHCGENLYEIYKAAYKTYFFVINDFVLDKIHDVNLHVREFAYKLEEDYFDTFSFIENSYNSYLGFVLRQIYKYNQATPSFKSIKELCNIIVNHDRADTYDDSKPIYSDIRDSYFIRDLMYLYRECAELLYYADGNDANITYQNLTFRGIDIIGKVNRYGVPNESTYEKDAYSCLIYMYIWFKQRFRITLSDEVVQKVLQYGEKYNKSLNTLLYISYILNENCVFDDEDVEKKVNEFFLEVVYKE